MKKLFFAVIAIMAFFAACQKNEIAEASRDGQVLYATIEDWSSTRTVMDEDNNIRWSEGDQIVGFLNSTLGLKYQVTASSVGQTSASFDEVSSGGLNAGTYLDHIIAYYPYSSAVKVAKSGADYALEVVLPSEQTYAHESFGNGSFPMVAVSETNNITFRNVCGGMKLQLKGTAKIASIKVKGKNNEKLSGKASVTAYTDGSKPSIVMADDASTSAVLNCGSGVQLNEDNATDFIISLPPTVFTKGFTITVTDINGGIQIIETSKSNTVLRSSLLVMPVVTVEISTVPREGDYIDEYGINHGQGVEIDGVVWAPVNCGYHATDFKYGKLYQWGRKYGQGYEGGLYDSNLNVIDDYSDAFVPEKCEGPLSLEMGQSIENENVFYYSSSEYDWCSSQNDFLWNSGTDETPVKTHYDPCPDGWRVPTRAELIGLTNNYSSWITLDSQNGYWFSGSTPYAESVPQVFLPAAGRRHSTDGNAYYRGSTGYYWTSRPWRHGADYFILRSQGVIWDFYERAVAFSVRCVRDTPKQSESSAVDLSEGGTANSYIVSEAGSYKFTPAKGNSNESVGAIASAETLWETFGTDVTPNVGDLVKNVKYENGMISFETPSTFKEGNAVIAAKNANGTILWSWHIWLTDKPEEQVYYNNAGTMMDRNLGATSATPGDVGGLGLLYQWGRKDPFLGSSSISEDILAKSTISWPLSVESNSSNGTIEYVTVHPTTFITNNSYSDWCYTGSSSTDIIRWTESSSAKSVYDPCPVGWRVPDGGDNGVWPQAVGSSSYFEGYQYDSTNEGMNFSGKFGSDQTIWYPASGSRCYDYGGGLQFVGYLGSYWSASPDSCQAYCMEFARIGFVEPSRNNICRASGYSVRCVRE